MSMCLFSSFVMLLFNNMSKRPPSAKVETGFSARGIHASSATPTPQLQIHDAAWSQQTHPPADSQQIHHASSSVEISNSGSRLRQVPELSSTASARVRNFNGTCRTWLALFSLFIRHWCAGPAVEVRYYQYYVQEKNLKLG